MLSVGRRRALTVAATGVAAAVAGLLFAGPASAHVTASAPGATEGGYTTITFKAPTESDTASTVGLKIAFPTDEPIASVSVQPKPGWTFTKKTTKLSSQLTSADGGVSEVVSEIDWKAQAGEGIKPGEFDTFVVSAGPLPKTDVLTFKAIQTYSDGSVVSWIQTKAPGSDATLDHPAPTVTLAPAAATSESSSAASGQPASSSADPSGALASSSDSGGTSTVAIVALVVAIVAALLAAAAALGVVPFGSQRGKGSSGS